MTTVRLAKPHKARDQHKGKDQLPMILLLQELDRVHLIQLQEDRKLLCQLSEVEQLDPVPLTRQAISHRDQLLVRITLRLLKVVLIIRHKLPPVVLLDINHLVHLNIQALQVHTQVLELQFHLQTCHLHTNPLKDSHHNQTLHIQPQERRKRRPEIIYRHDGDKFMQTIVYISLFMLQVIHIKKRNNIQLDRWTSLTFTHFFFCILPINSIHD